MAELNRSDTVTKAIVAAQEEAATIPLREDDNDDETIHALTMDTPPTIDTSMFDVFTDFDLDLTCLSRPGSPSPSTSEIPPTTPSPPSSPSSSPPQLSRSMSFTSHLGPLAGSLTTTKKTSKKSSSQHLSSTAPSSSRGSWPLIKYAGRGTPIDRNRRLEWGGFLSEEVAEDGLLFSTVRSTSLDSAVRPSQRSISPEWTYASPLSSSVSHSEHSERLSSASSHGQDAAHEPPPEIAPIQGLGLDKSDEWDSIMKTVLSSSNAALSPPGESSDAAEKEQDVSGNAESSGSGSGSGSASENIVQLSPEHLEQINAGLEMDLGLSKALDLGLGQHGGMNWFALGLLPSSGASGRASGRESPSVYSSQAATPRASIHGSEHASEHRSTTSTKAGAANDPVRDGLKVETTKWWQKMLLRLRRVHNIMTIHKNRF